jgi:GTP 3',8-cyclase
VEGVIDLLAPATNATVTPLGQANSLTDRFGRRIDHLRLSVTSACDLRCVYCRPTAASASCGQNKVSDKQRVAFVRFLVERFGLSQVRLTGGEPLIYPSIVPLIGQIRDAAPGVELALTTNGRRLGPLAHDLRSAGLNRLNVSLDSLTKEGYRRITGGRLADVLSGLDAAIEAGFPPPKINTVVLKHHNDGELVDIVQWALSRGFEIRFLEAMPIGPAADFNRQHFFSAAAIRRSLSRVYRLSPLPQAHGETAVRYDITGASVSGRIGIIAPVTHPFCGGCRRIRLTADGRLFPCLLDKRHVAMHDAWTEGRFDPQAAAKLVLAAVEQKQARGYIQPVPMVALGG